MLRAALLSCWTGDRIKHVNVGVVAEGRSPALRSLTQRERPSLDGDPPSCVHDVDVDVDQDQDRHPPVSPCAHPSFAVHVIKYLTVDHRV